MLEFHFCDFENVEGDYVNLENCNFVSNEMGQGKWGHFRLKSGDLLISTSASLGRVSQVRDDAAGAIAYTGLIRFRSKSPELQIDYLMTYLQSRSFIEQAESSATGSVIRHFGPTHLKKMSIALPSLLVQEAVGSFDKGL